MRLVDHIQDRRSIRSSRSSEATTEDIEAALACIPADDRDTWLRTAMSIKSEIGDSGFGLWNKWSQSSGNYNVRSARSVWKSITANGGITIATLFHEAQQHGFKRSNRDSIAPPRTVKSVQPSTQQAQHETLSQVATELWRACKSLSGIAVEYL